MTDVLKDEVNNYLIMTQPEKSVEGSFETSVYQIVDTGLLFVDRKYRFGFDEAKKMHGYMKKYAETIEHTCEECEDSLNTIWSKIYQKHLCPVCLNERLEACR